MRACGALLLLVLAGCTDEVKLTQVVVTVDSDLAVPDELDNISIEVTGLVRAASAHADLTMEGLPRTLSIVHDGGSYGPLVVTAQGRLGASVVLEREVEFSFERDRTLALLLELASACVGTNCSGTDTCVAGMCVARGGGPLPPFDGVIRGGVFATVPAPAGTGGSGGAGASASDAGPTP